MVLNAKFGTSVVLIAALKVKIIKIDYDGAEQKYTSTAEVLLVILKGWLKLLLRL